MSITMAAAAMKEPSSGPGRPREGEPMSGPGYRLAEFLDAQWERVGMSNREVSLKFGFRSPNIVSMWRMGKVKVALDRLPQLADLLRVDLAILLPLWFDQELGVQGEGRAAAEVKLNAVERVLTRVATLSEFAIIRALRDVFGKKDPAFTAEQIQAMVAIAQDEKLADKVLKMVKPAAA